MEDYRADYDIGGTGRYFPTPRGVNISGTGADYHYRNESQFFRAIERARGYDRNNMIVGQAVSRLTANLVQDGFTPDPQTTDADTDTELKTGWADWAGDASACDYERERTFHEMEWLATRAIPVDGDNYCIPRPSGQLQFLEAHRNRRPASSRSKNCIHGVNVNPQTGERLSYYFTKEDIDGFGTVKTLNDVIEIKARDSAGEKQVLHLHWSNRFSQRRGVTAFAPIALPTQYHDDIQFASLVAAQAQSCYAILEQQLQGLGSGLPTPPRTGGEPATGATTTETLSDGTTATRQGLTPGMRIRAREGWGLTGFAPTIPGPQYKEHMLMVLSIIAVNLDLPLCVLLLDASNTNFSGFRGAIDQARIRYRVLQKQQVGRFYRPIWRWRVRHMIAKSPKLQAKLKAGLPLFAHQWHPPTWSYIEPEKDIKANAMELATYQTSPRRQRARQGEDFNDIAGEFVADAGILLDLAEAKAAELNKKYSLGDDSPHRFTRGELLRLFTASGVNVSSPQEQPPQESKAATSGRGSGGAA
jgi:capsid protein